ncbi:MAG: DUF2934 domain-containing protein [Pseudomonadota bacterium]
MPGAPWAGACHGAEILRRHRHGHRFQVPGARRGPVTAEERERLIATTAYYRTERRGFAPGYELEDWCEAEAEIDRQLGRG